MVNASKAAFRTVAVWVGWNKKARDGSAAEKPQSFC